MSEQELEDIKDDVDHGEVEEKIAEEATEEAPEVEAAPTYSEEDAEEAKAFGWKAPEEWAGDKPPGYIDDPARYMERIQGSRPFKVMNERLAKSEQAAQESLRKAEAMNAQALQIQKQNYEQNLAEIQQQQRIAVQESDTTAFDALEDRKKNLRPPAEPVAPPQPAGPPAEVTAYREANEWAKDDAMWQLAVAEVDANPAIQQRPVQEQLNYAEGALRAKYSHIFNKPEPAPKRVQQRVDGGGLAGGSASAPSAFSKLPADAKAAFARFAKDEIFEDNAKGREEYAAEYNAA